MRVFTLVLLISLLACARAPHDESSTLIGSYRLIEWKGVKPDGEFVYPYGDQAEGLIQYDRNGMMGMQLQRGQRTLLGSDAYDSLDADLIREAFKSFFSYFGPFSVDSKLGVVTHTIEGCKNPDWVGRELKRRFTLSEDTLTIRTDSVIGMDHILKWKRLVNQE